MLVMVVPSAAWRSVQSIDSGKATMCPVSTTRRSPAASSTRSMAPSLATTSGPAPLACTMKPPSPPNSDVKPFHPLSISTDDAQARKLPRSSTRGVSDWSSSVVTSPGSCGATSTQPPPSGAVKVVMKERLAPEHPAPERLHQPTPHGRVDRHAVRHGEHRAGLGPDGLSRAEAETGDGEARRVADVDVHRALQVDGCAAATPDADVRKWCHLPPPTPRRARVRS